MDGRVSGDAAPPFWKLDPNEWPGPVPVPTDPAARPSSGSKSAAEENTGEKKEIIKGSGGSSKKSKGKDKDSNDKGTKNKTKPKKKKKKSKSRTAD